MSTAGRRRSGGWAGNSLTPAEVRGLIERHPEIAPLGETGVTTLAREGFRWIQMAGLVRTVQAGTTTAQQ